MRDRFPHISQILEGIHFGANSCHTCIQTRAIEYRKLFLANYILVSCQGVPTWKFPQLSAESCECERSRMVRQKVPRRPTFRNFPSSCRMLLQQRIQRFSTFRFRRTFRGTFRKVSAGFSAQSFRGTFLGWRVCTTKLPPNIFELDTKNGLKNAKQDPKNDPKRIRKVFSSSQVA